MRGWAEGAFHSASRRGSRRASPALAAALCVLMLAALAPAAQADPFAEIPVRHWSFDALALLVSPGLVNAPALDLYRSRPGVMRFELALLVSQAVFRLEGAEPPVTFDLDRLTAATANRSGDRYRLSQAQAQALRRLLSEFASELEVLGVRVAGSAAPAPSPLGPPSSAQGPFVDLETLAKLVQEGGPAAAALPSAGPESLPAAPPALAAAAPAPGVIAPPPSLTTGQTPITPPGLPVAALPDAALSAQATDGPFAGEVSAGQPPVTGPTLATRPALAISGSVQAPEARLPLPKKANLSVAPTVRVSGSLTTGDPVGQGAGAVEVEAAVTVGGVQVGANLRNAQAAVEPAAGLKVGPVSETQGYGLNVRLGQVAVATGYSEVKREEANVEKRRSLEVGYALGESAVVRAGYQLVDVDAIPGKSRTDATVGVNVNLKRTATVSAGLTLEGLQSALPGGQAEGSRATAGVELRLPWNAFVTAGYEYYRPFDESDRPQSAATIGLGYNFATNATLLVGYRLIDFDAANSGSGTAPQQNLTAGVSLTF